MTTLNAAQATDMTTWDLHEIDNGTAFTHTATHWNVNNASFFLDFLFTGTGLTYPGGADPKPNGGTINSFIFKVNDAVEMTVIGNISASELTHFINADNAAGLQKIWFKGDDIFNGSSGDDHFLGYNGKDVFNLQDGGSDTAEGGDANDTFNMGEEFHGTDLIFGGAGNDTVVLKGPYHQMLGTIGVEKYVLKSGFDYELVTDGSSVGNGGLVIDASALKSSDSTELFVGGNKGVTMLGGHGSDNLIGTGGADVLNGGEGNDILKGDRGGDTLTGGKDGDGFIYSDAGESTSNNFDTIVDFHAADDTFFFDAAVTSVHTPVHGNLSLGSFDDDMESAIGATQLLKHGAVLFFADTGSLAGSVFLIVDEAGGAGYQHGRDYVILMQDHAHLSGLNLSNFDVNA